MTERPDLHTLRRLLGPAGPEVSCDVCFQELDRYVELELAGADADAAGCPACREEHDSLHALVGGERPH